MSRTLNTKPALPKKERFPVRICSWQLHQDHIEERKKTKWFPLQDPSRCQIKKNRFPTDFSLMSVQNHTHVGQTNSYRCPQTACPSPEPTPGSRRNPGQASAEASFTTFRSCIQVKRDFRSFWRRVSFSSSFAGDLCFLQPVWSESDLLYGYGEIFHRHQVAPLHANQWIRLRALGSAPLLIRSAAGSGPGTSRCQGSRLYISFRYRGAGVIWIPELYPALTKGGISLQRYRGLGWRRWHQARAPLLAGRWTWSRTSRHALPLLCWQLALLRRPLRAWTHHRRLPRVRHRAHRSRSRQKHPVCH